MKLILLLVVSCLALHNGNGKNITTEYTVVLLGDCRLVLVKFPGSSPGATGAFRLTHRSSFSVTGSVSVVTHFTVNSPRPA